MTLPPTLLTPREAYRLWAQSYESETAVSALDDLAVAELCPTPAGRLLDAGCGTGRRLPPPHAGVAFAIGIDLVYEMLAAGARHGRHQHQLAAADVRALPFAAGTFDTIWCRLVLGHVPDLSPAYHEFFRVSSPGSRLIVTDFHPNALAAGHARTFRDERGRLHAVETYAHDTARHQEAGLEAGFRLEREREWRVGPELRGFYQAAAALELYRQQQGMALLLALHFVR